MKPSPLLYGGIMSVPIGHRSFSVTGRPARIPRLNPRVSDAALCGRRFGARVSHALIFINAEMNQTARRLRRRERSRNSTNKLLKTEIFPYDQALEKSENSVPDEGGPLCLKA